MSNLPMLGPDDLDEDQAALWTYLVEGARSASFREPVTALPGPYNSWLQIPSFGRVAAEMGERLRLHGVLSDRLREIAVLTVGAWWRAEFEFWAHAQVGRRAGVPENIIEALRTGAIPQLEAENERLVHEATRALLETGRLSDDLGTWLADALGWPGLVELVSLVGYYCMISFTLNAFDVALPNGEAPVWPR